MNIVGFFFTKVHAHKASAIKKGFSKNFTVDITDVEKEEASFATKGNLIKVAFKYEVLYTDPAVKANNILGELSLHGNITLMMSPEETQEFLKLWKGKKVPPTVHEFLVNFLLKKCAPRALEMEDAVNLPFHIPIQRAKINPKTA